jgi:hypothetical protein
MTQTLMQMVKHYNDTSNLSIPDFTNPRKTTLKPATLPALIQMLDSASSGVLTYHKINYVRILLPEEKT